jgi:hypothetical protein
MSTPTQRIRRDVRVFVSAVTRELGTVRKIVKKGLEDNDYHGVEQDNFALDYRDVVDKLRARIESCDAVIHIAGLCYGAEPKNRPADALRRSYTQLEYDIGLELKKPVYVFLTADGFPTDPHDPETAELKCLQEAHRRALTSTDTDYCQSATVEQLDQKIRSLQLKVERLENELWHVDREVAVAGHRLGRWLALVAAVAVVTLCAVAFVAWQQRGEAARREVQRQQAFAERFLQLLVADKETTPAEARRRALRELPALVNLPQDEITSLIERKFAPRSPAPGASPLEKMRALLLKGDYTGVLRAADEQKRQGREAAMLEGTAALALFRESPSPDARKRALAAFEQAMGLADPDSATEWNAWTDAAIAAARVLSDQAREQDAEPLLRRALQVRESWSGPSSPAVAEVLNNLAELFRATNRMLEAEPLYRRAIAIDERSLGPSDGKVAANLNNLALVLQATHRMAAAEPLFRRALAIDEQAFGPGDYELASDLNNLALLLKETSRMAEAEPLFRRALGIVLRTRGRDNPEVAAHLNNLAQLLQSTGRAGDAEPLYRRAFEIAEHSNGPDHPDVATYLGNLAILLELANRLDAAEPLMRRSICIFTRFQRSNNAAHPLMPEAMNYYRQILAKQKLTAPNIAARMKAAGEGPAELLPIAPEVERLLGPTRRAEEVLTSLSGPYEAQQKPSSYPLTPDQPIAAPLDDLLRPSAAGLDALAVDAYRGSEFADAIVLTEAALPLLANQPEQLPEMLKARMNHAAALRELGSVFEARDKLLKMLPEFDKLPAAALPLKGRASYHLALCQWLLGEKQAAQTSAARSLAAYDAASSAVPAGSDVRRQSENLIKALKTGEAPPSVAVIDGRAAIEAARDRYLARDALMRLGLDKPAAPLLDQLLGTVKSTTESAGAIGR